MTDEPLDLDPIKARIKSATPGPWYRYGDLSFEIYTELGEDVPDVCSGFSRPEDSEFVTHVRDDVPALVAEVEALREGMHAYTEHASRWKRERDEARAIITRAHHESIAGDGRSSVVLATVRDILAEVVTE